MQDNNIALGLELINANPSGIDALKNEAKGQDNISVLMLDGVDGQPDRYFLLPINDDSSAILESCADSLGMTEAKVKIVVIDSSRGEVREARNLTEEFQQDQDIDDKIFTLATMFDIYDFVEENPSLVQSELDEMKKESQTVNNVSNETVDTPTEKSLGTTNQNVDVQGLNSTQTEEGINRNISEVEEHSIDDNNQIDQLFDEKDNQDPVYQEAVRKVNDSIQFSMPVFDTLTQRELQPYIIEMENGFYAVKDGVIQRVYEELLSVKEDTEKNVEKVNIEKARQAHEVALEKLKANRKVDLTNAVQSKNDEYTANQQAYIDAAIPVLKEEYDSKHLENHMAVIDAAKKAIETEYDQQIQTENDKFNDYVESVKTASVEQAWNSVSIDNHLIELKNFIQDQIKLIKERANDFRGQVDNATKEIRGNLDTVKTQLAEAEQNNRVLRNSIDQQVQARVEQKVSDARVKSNDQIEHYKTKAERLESKYQEVDDYNQELKQKLKHQEDSFRNQVSELREKLLDASKTSTPATPVEQPTKKGLLENINKYAGIATLLIVFVFGSFWMGKSMNSNQQTQAAPAVTEVAPSKSASTSTSTSSSKLKKGETFSYKTKNGKNVQVIVDSAHAGHYIDDNGKVHSVIF